MFYDLITLLNMEISIRNWTGAYGYFQFPLKRMQLLETWVEIQNQSGIAPKAVSNMPQTRPPRMYMSISYLAQRNETTELLTSPRQKRMQVSDIQSYRAKSQLGITLRNQGQFRWRAEGERSVHFSYLNNSNNAVIIIWYELSIPATRDILIFSSPCSKKMKTYYCWEYS